MKLFVGRSFAWESLFLPQHGWHLFDELDPRMNQILVDLIWRSNPLERKSRSLLWGVALTLVYPPA